PEDLFCLTRPRTIRAGIKEPRIAVVISGGVRQRTRHEHRRAIFVRRSASRVVLLATLATEREREQRLLARPRHVLLLLRGDVTIWLGLEGRIDRFAATEELMNPEGEDRKAILLLDLVAAHQR